MFNVYGYVYIHESNNMSDVYVHVHTCIYIKYVLCLFLCTYKYPIICLMFISMYIHIFKNMSNVYVHVHTSIYIKYVLC